MGQYHAAGQSGGEGYKRRQQLVRGGEVGRTRTEKEEKGNKRKGQYITEGKGREERKDMEGMERRRKIGKGLGIVMYKSF